MSSSASAAESTMAGISGVAARVLGSADPSELGVAPDPIGPVHAPTQRATRGRGF